MIPLSMVAAQGYVFCTCLPIHGRLNTLISSRGLWNFILGKFSNANFLPSATELTKYATETRSKGKQEVPRAHVSSILCFCKIKMQSNCISRHFYGPWSLCNFYYCTREFRIRFARFEGLLSEIAGFVEVYFFCCGFRWNCTILGIGLDGLDLPLGKREACYLPRDHGGRVRGLQTAAVLIRKSGCDRFSG